MKAYILKRKTEIKIVSLLVYISLVSLLTPVAVLHCYSSRGYFAIGGEWLGLLTIPIALGLVCELYIRTV